MGAAGIYTANLMRKHSKWKKNGCSGISDSVEKAKCQKYMNKHKVQ
jgi:hypothetical protein